MAYTKKSGEAVARYISKAYDQIVLRVPKGKRDVYKTYAEGKGMSLNAYVVQLIEQDMEKG